MVNQQFQPNNNNKVAFVLGNGVSRLRLNLPALRKYGTIYGCNALYREFEPDYLVAVDAKMVHEIVGAHWHLGRQVWTNPNKEVLQYPGIHFFNPHKGWSSGPTALWLASTHGYEKIFIFGFDYEGVDGQVNNIYANTPNYKRGNEAPTYYGNWLNQTERIIKEFNQIKYHRIIEPGKFDFVPPQLSDITKNLEHNTYEEFAQEYSGTILS